MFEYGVPIAIGGLNEKTIQQYLEDFKACGISRVFMASLGYIYDPCADLYKHAEKMQKAIKIFHENGYTVGVWVSAFGHGVRLPYMNVGFDENKYTEIEGIGGDKYGDAFCPLDENFRHDYAEGIKFIARMNPDIIMLYDDFRLNTRRYYFGCFCERHRAEYFARLGEDVPRADLERLMFTGGKNKYRSTYLQLASDTLTDFAKMLRAEVDKINPAIRLGACTVAENWDLSGNAIEVAYAFAGQNTLPFTRTCGAPYWNGILSDAIEDNRMEAAWCKDSGIEIFAEGDTYPRPRYYVPSSRLELFDLALLADGSLDGDLKYMYEYVSKPDNERGYVQRHIRNTQLRNELSEIFSAKSPVGIRSYNVMRKIENYVLPNTLTDVQPATKMFKFQRSASRLLLSQNGIPTRYTDGGDMPVFLYGENARYVTEDDLKNGAILDVDAAIILNERGIDTGLVSTESASFTREYFIDADDTVPGIGGGVLKKIKCAEGAKVLSVFLPDKTPSAYTYENKNGQRFLVIAHDGYRSSVGQLPNFCNSYHRQEQIISSVRWLCGKKLPAVCKKAPYLYILASKGKSGMAVALCNCFGDDIISPVVELDGKYDQIRFVGCDGRLEGDKVYLTDIAPFGFAAFEVK